MPRPALFAPNTLLEEEITAVGVGDEVCSESLSKLVVYLQSHGVRVCEKHVPLSAYDVCAGLLILAKRVESDLIVAGIRTGENFVERLFGGKT